MKGRCWINKKDAFIFWGVILSSAAINALRTPAPMKANVENKSRLEDGKRVVHDSASAKVDERDINLAIYIKANSQEQYNERFDSFIDELQSKQAEIEIAENPGVIYRCDYQNATQYSQFNGKLGKMTLRLNEPNPKDRAKND